MPTHRRLLQILSILIILTMLFSRVSLTSASAQGKDEPKHLETLASASASLPTLDETKWSDNLVPEESANELTSLTGATWYVATTGNDSNLCSTPALPCATINGALSQASSGDTIYVAQGRYTKQTYDFLSWIVDIKKGVTILGGWDSTFTKQGSP